MSDGLKPHNVRVRDGRVAERPWTPEGYFLLAEAFEVFGQACFGDTWTGNEQRVRRGVPSKPEPPREPDPDFVIDIKEADGITRTVENAVRYPVNGQLKWMTYEEAQQLYEKEKDARLKQWEGLCGAYERYRETAYRIRQVFGAQSIPVSVLTVSGHLEPVPVSVWAADTAMKILETGQVRFIHPKSYSMSSVEGRVIVPEGDLRAYIERNSRDEGDPASPVTADSAERGERGAISSAIKTASSGGRPQKWDWEGCWLEMCRISYLDGLPATRAEMTGKLKDWFIGAVGDHPSDSEIRKRVSLLFRTLQDAENLDC